MGQQQHFFIQTVRFKCSHNDTPYVQTPNIALVEFSVQFIKKENRVIKDELVT